MEKIQIQALFVALIVFVIYTTVIAIRYGIQKSISQSYYQLPDIWKPIFTIFCFVFSIASATAANSILMFIACIGISFVGAAAAIREKLTNIVHMIGAGVGVLFCQLSIFFDFKLWQLNVLFLISSLLMIIFRKSLMNNKHLWWIEVVAFVTTMTAIFINLICK